MVSFSLLKLSLLVIAIVGLTIVILLLFQKIRSQSAKSVRQQQALARQYAREMQAVEMQSLNLSAGKLRSEKRFRHILDSAAEGIYGLDMNGNFTFVNKAALQMLGYESEAELLGQSAYQTVSLSKSDGTKYSMGDSGMFRAQQDSRQWHQDVEVLRTQSGKTLPVEIWFYPLYEDEVICGSVVTFIDISEAMRIRAERRTIEHKFQHLMDVSPDAIFVSDYQGVVQYVNQATLHLLGYERAEMLGKSFFDFVPDKWRELYRKNLSELVQVKKHMRIESPLLRKDGRRVELELNANCIFNDGLVYGAFRDIGQSKEVEKRMKQLVDKMTLATSAARMGVVDFNIAEDLLVFDRRGCQLHGFTEQDEYRVNYAGYQETLHPEDRAGVHDKVMQAIADHGDLHMQFRVILPGGQIRNIEAFVNVTLDSRGEAARMLGVCRDITQQKLDEYEINLLAFYDPLTKLPNRRLLLDRLKHALAVSAHAQSYGAVLFLDLDHFKILNDTRGHDVGDLLLLEVAARLQSSLREGDSVARLGGDEFVVILESLSTHQELAMHQTELVAGKIRDLLSRAYELNGYVYQTSSSIGISLFMGHRDSVDNLLKHADSAMYQAKAAGRGVYRFFDPHMQNMLEQRALLEDDLRRALERPGELQLYYQVQVDQFQRAVGAEILLRWQHPQRGMVYPDEFIALAEETGLIVPIGDWIMKSAVVQLSVWQKLPQFCNIHLSVNVSEKQFRRDDFVGKLRRLFKVSGVSPALLKLELTESSMLENVTDTIAKMGELKKLGVQFSLDDFGTGYSSLAYLKQLPLSQIKIDQSFVRDIASDANDAAIVVMIIAMSKALGLNVLAEGVETARQRDFLEANGCFAYQGYLFGKPVPLAEFENLVSRPIGLLT